MALTSDLTSAPGTQLANTIYGYPTDTKVMRFQNDNGEVHLLWGSDATPVTNHANAPNGSIYINLTVTAGNQKIWVKYDAQANFGANGGTWRATAQLT